MCLGAGRSKRQRLNDAGNQLNDVSSAMVTSMCTEVTNQLVDNTVFLSSESKHFVKTLQQTETFWGSTMTATNHDGHNDHDMPQP